MALDTTEEHKYIPSYKLGLGYNKQIDSRNIPWKFIFLVILLIMCVCFQAMSFTRLSETPKNSE
jgi:hypothetical protein